MCHVRGASICGYIDHISYDQRGQDEVEICVRSSVYSEQTPAYYHISFSCGAVGTNYVKSDSVLVCVEELRKEGDGQWRARGLWMKALPMGTLSPP
jgi:hypothetical protein